MRRSTGTVLTSLLRQMSPRLVAGEYVCCTFPPGKLPDALAPICIFQEKEGISAICRRSAAQRLGIPASGCFRQITLTVHSSLDAVGFLAAVTAELAGAGIACNPISAFHHDHLFVPQADARRALGVLRRLSARHRR